jgi:uncharacterized protein YjiS (DUF1127 family)
MSTIDTSTHGHRHVSHGGKSVAAWLLAAMERRRSRVDLLSLTTAQLEDIGISPQMARREGLRPFWE